MELLSKPCSCTTHGSVCHSLRVTLGFNVLEHKEKYFFQHASTSKSSIICCRRDNRGLASGRGLAVMGGSGCSARERVWHPSLLPPSPPSPSHFPGPGAPLTTGHQPAGQVHRSLTIHFLPPSPRAVGSAEERREPGAGPAQAGQQATSSRAGPLAGSGHHAVSTPGSNLNRSPGPRALDLNCHHGRCRVPQVCPKHLQQEQVFGLLPFEGGPLGVSN